MATYNGAEFDKLRECAGPGDSLSLLGLCEAYSFVAYVFVPASKHLKTALRDNAAHKPIIFGWVPRVRLPKLHMRLVDHHFDALMPSTSALGMQYPRMHDALVFLNAETDPATGGCALLVITGVANEQVIAFCARVTKSRPH